MAETDQKKIKGIVARIGLGEEQAFVELLGLYEARVFTFSYRMCGNKQDAEDGTQEVFLSALKSLGQFRWEVPLLSWLFKIAANRCRRMKRLKSGQPRRMESLETFEAPGKSKDPLEQTMQRRQEKELQLAMLKLDKDARLLVVLRDMQGQSTRETAQILGMTEGAVKTGLHRARKQLKGLIGHVEF